MNFESYTERINLLKESGREKNEKKLIKKILEVKNTEIKMTNVNKAQFANLMINDTIFLLELFLSRSIIQHYLPYAILKSLIQKFTPLLRMKKKGSSS